MATPYQRCCSCHAISRSYRWSNALLSEAASVYRKGVGGYVHACAYCVGKGVLFWCKTPRLGWFVAWWYQQLFARTYSFREGEPGFSLAGGKKWNNNTTCPAGQRSGLGLAPWTESGSEITDAFPPPPAYHMQHPWHLLWAVWDCIVHGVCCVHIHMQLVEGGSPWAA